MSLRKIHIANEKSRDSLIDFKGYLPSSNAVKVDATGAPVQNKKVIKGTSENTIDGLKATYGDDLEVIAENLINSDPEISLEVTGQFLGKSPRVYVNEALEVVYKVNKKEKVFDAEGKLTEERDLRQLVANVISEDPLKWSGKFFPIEKSYNKFVFIRTYQLFHDSGLTYDFLYGMTKELEEKKSFMLLGSGKKGVGPAIFQEGGQPFRIFLEGRTQGDDYMLLMHLSNLELKPIL